MHSVSIWENNKLLQKCCFLYYYPRKTWCSIISDWSGYIYTHTYRERGISSHQDLNSSNWHVHTIQQHILFPPFWVIREVFDSGFKKKNCNILWFMVIFFWRTIDINSVDESRSLSFVSIWVIFLDVKNSNC